MKKKQMVLGLLIGILIVYIFTTVIVDSRLNDLVTHLDTRIQTQTEELKEISLIIGRGGVTEDLEAVIASCPADEANQYDSLLTALDKGLTKVELQGLNILFKRCGSIPASRRAGMALIFESEVNLLSELVNQRSLLGDYKIDETDLASWNALVSKEKDISKLFFDLVAAQRQIITTLAGENPTGASVEEIQTEAQKVRTNLDEATEAAFEIRTALTST